MKKFRLTIPTMGAVALDTMRAAERICAAAGARPPEYMVATNSAGETKCRIVRWFMWDTDDEYLIILDDDVVPPKNFLSLLDRELPIVGGVYPLMNPRLCMMPFDGAYVRQQKGGYLPIEDDGTRHGLVECDAICSGAICIHRSVFEKIRPAFCEQYDDWGIVTKSDDIYFCERAKEQGFKIYADLDVKCEHLKRVGLRDMTNRIATSIQMWNAMQEV
jgi:hypothetical protein